MKRRHGEVNVTVMQDRERPDWPLLRGKMEECEQPPEAERQENNSPPGTTRNPAPSDTEILAQETHFRPLTSSSVREDCCFKPLSLW